MAFRQTSIRVRFLFGVVFVVVLAGLYVRALATGRAFGTFASFAHPWHDFVADTFILGLSVGLFACMMPIILREGLSRRVFGILLLLLPAGVLGHFALWLLRIHGN